MPTPIERLTAALADRYRIERELGAGGMATVYLAADLKHDRKVAIKVLKPELAAVLGAERFVVEIKTTAALQHPHILPLFDSGTADGFLFYVMPFIQGETLRDKLNREHQFSVDEALRITREVADALDYAHRHGVIHRDIKPENILLHDGRPMVADFGIALALSAAAGGRMTETGLSLGTPHYMSPEQATAEKEITGRSDVYSLASVLYEMLSGEPPHTGKSAQQIIMKIIAEPVKPVSEWRKSVPPHVVDAVSHALEKLPADRFGTAAEFAAALGNTGYTLQGLTGATGAGTRGRVQWNPLTIGLAGVAVAASIVALWLTTRPAAELPTRQFSLSLPQSQPLGATALNRVALAPDGSGYVYVAASSDGVERLVFRSFGDAVASVLPGTEYAGSPAFSPDGSRIVFLAYTPFAVRVVGVNGAPPITLATESVVGGGVAWGTDDWIYFDAGTSISRIRSGGTDREVVVALDSAVSEVGFAWPEPLPNKRGLLYRSRRAGDPTSRYVLKALDLRTRESKVLVQGLIGRYSPTGHLLYVTADGVLLAAPFDQDRMEITGLPVPLAEGIGVAGFGGVDLVLSPKGDLLFVRANTSGGERLAWVRRDAAATPVDPDWTAGVEEIDTWALSPDGRRLALAIGGGGNAAGSGGPVDIWVKELDRGPMSKLTFEGVNLNPTWSRDGRFIYYASGPALPLGSRQLYRISSDGAGQPEPLLRTPNGVQFINATHPDGWVVVSTGDVPTAADLLAYRPGRDTAWTPLLTTQAPETHPVVSPDGRWLAYVSGESGRAEVYIRPFPEVNRGKWQVSTDGGFWPRWAHSGAELFYSNLASGTIVAEIRTAPSLSVGRRQTLFSSGTVGQFEIAPDDQRFLRLWIRGTTDSIAPELVLIQNGLGRLRERR